MLRRRRRTMALRALRPDQRGLRLPLRVVPALRRQASPRGRGAPRRRPGCGGRRRAHGLRDRTRRACLLPARRRRSHRSRSAPTVRPLRPHGGRAHGNADAPLPPRCAAAFAGAAPRGGSHLRRGRGPATGPGQPVPHRDRAGRARGPVLRQRAPGSRPQARPSSGCISNWRPRNTNTPACWPASWSAGRAASPAGSAPTRRAPRRGRLARWMRRRTPRCCCSTRPTHSARRWPAARPR